MTCVTKEDEDRLLFKKYDKQMIEEQDRIILEWENVNFYVPIKSKRTMIIKSRLNNEVVDTESLLP